MLIFFHIKNYYLSNFKMPNSPILYPKIQGYNEVTSYAVCATQGPQMS